MSYEVIGKELSNIFPFDRDAGQRRLKFVIFLRDSATGESPAVTFELPSRLNDDSTVYAIFKDAEAQIAEIVRAIQGQ